MLFDAMPLEETNVPNPLTSGSPRFGLLNSSRLDMFLHFKPRSDVRIIYDVHSGKDTDTLSIRLQF